MCAPYSCSRVTGVDAIDHFEPSCVLWVSSGSEPLSTTPVDRSTERSMRFCSSWTSGNELRASPDSHSLW